MSENLPGSLEIAVKCQDRLNLLCFMQTMNHRSFREGESRTLPVLDYSRKYARVTFI